MTAAALSDGVAAEAIVDRLDALAEHRAVSHGGRTVRWRRFGAGPPMILLHGGHGTWLHWVRNIEALSGAHTLWIPDLPGFGDSDDLSVDGRDPERLERLVDALHETLNALVGATTSIDLVGFSFGAVAAASLAARGGGVRRLALLGPAGHGTARRQRDPLVQWRSPDPASMRDACRRNLSALMLHDAANVDALAEYVHARSCAGSRFASKAISRSSVIGDLLVQCPGPVLLIWGEHDVTAFPADVAGVLSERRANLDWCLVPRAGHWVQYERCDDVNRLLLRWFAPDATDQRKERLS